YDGVSARLPGTLAARVHGDSFRRDKKRRDSNLNRREIPYYKIFKGVVESCGDYRYVISGEISVIGSDKVEITELPIGTWTQTYKETVLEPMLHGTDKVPAIITDYKEYNTDTAVHFIVILNRDKLVELEREGLHKVFKLQTTMARTSMCAFDENQCLNKYDNAKQMLKRFRKVPLEAYDQYRILEAESARLFNQTRFIFEICNGTLVIKDKKKKDMIAELVRCNYNSDPVVPWKLFQNREEVLEDQEEAVENDEEAAPTASTIEKENFDYLLEMPMSSLMKEKKDHLLRQECEKDSELNRFLSRTQISLSKKDLEYLFAELDILNKLEEKEKKDQNKAKQNMKNPPWRFYKNDDTRRIVPFTDVELKKKIEKADIVSKDKKEGIKKPKMKKEPILEEKDEFDTLVDAYTKPLEHRLGNSPEKIEKKVTAKKGLKQTTLRFKPIKKGAKKKEKDSDDSDDIDFGNVLPPPQPRASRRAAAKKNYNMSSEDSDDSNELFSRPSSDSEQTTMKKESIMVLTISDSDDNIKPSKKLPQSTPTSEELFDSLVGNTPDKQSSSEKKSALISSSEEDSLAMFTPPKKAPAKKKTENGGNKGVKRQKKKPKSSEDSDTDDLFVTKQSHAKKKKKKSDSDEEMRDDDSPPPPLWKIAGRARKHRSYGLKMSLKILRKYPTRERPVERYFVRL
ncbi:PREDICTED: DNA topoisomerase 2-alpha-like, partial [Vollenhovia emeryi]|uniref:DNA topoisomerase 2-alpha-like n=1 Tax=Vollenhovia emeryi TaxID=411798 RepID=UPI0005F50908